MILKILRPGVYYILRYLPKINQLCFILLKSNSEWRLPTTYRLPEKKNKKNTRSTFDVFILYVKLTQSRNSDANNRARSERGKNLTEFFIAVGRRVRISSEGK